MVDNRDGNSGKSLTKYKVNNTKIQDIKGKPRTIEKDKETTLIGQKGNKGLLIINEQL